VGPPGPQGAPGTPASPNPGARVFATGPEQSIPSGSGGTPVIFTATSFNDAPGGTPMWSAGAPTRLTAQVAGRYVIAAEVHWDEAAGAGTFRELNIRLNGAALVASVLTPPVTGGAATGQSVSTIVNMNVGDFVEATVDQNSGLAIGIFVSPSISPEFMMNRIGP